MKKTLAIKEIIAILIVFALMLGVVGCKPSSEPEDSGNSGDNSNSTVDKTALHAELAREITEQGDYTLDSYNQYLSRLAQAKQTYNDSSATQDDVDRATQALSAARLALAIRPVTEVAGADKTLVLGSGAVKEIVLAEYIDVNNLSKITYTVEASDALLTLGSVSDGKFTVTAGDVEETAYATVTVSVYYDGGLMLRVELFVQVSGEVNDSSTEFTPDDNVDTDW